MREIMSLNGRDPVRPETSVPIILHTYLRIRPDSPRKFREKLLEKGKKRAVLTPIRPPEIWRKFALFHLFWDGRLRQ